MDSKEVKEATEKARLALLASIAKSAESGGAAHAQAYAQALASLEESRLTANHAPS